MADRSALSFKYRRGRRYFHRLGHRAGLELEVDHYVRAHIYRDIRLRGGLEPLEGCRDLVTPDFERRELVTSIRSCIRREGRTGPFIGQRHFSAVDRRPRSVRHGP